MIISKKIKRRRNLQRRKNSAIYNKNDQIDRFEIHHNQNETNDSIEFEMIDEKRIANSKTNQQNNTNRTNSYLFVDFRECSNRKIDILSSKSTCAFFEHDFEFKKRRNHHHNTKCE